ARRQPSHTAAPGCRPLPLSDIGSAAPARATPGRAITGAKPILTGNHVFEWLSDMQLYFLLGRGKVHDGLDCGDSSPLLASPQAVFCCDLGRVRGSCPARLFRHVCGDLPMPLRWLYAALVVLGLPLAASAEDKRGLELYFIDTEGGAATLIVTPRGES